MSNSGETKFQVEEEEDSRWEKERQPSLLTTPGTALAVPGGGPGGARSGRG